MEIFSLKNQIEKVLRGDNSNFLSPIEIRYIINILNKRHFKYKIFKPFEESEKNIIYTNKLDIVVFKIESNKSLTHQEILGSLFSHNLNESFFGDIIIDSNCYIVALNKIKDYLKNNFIEIGRKNIKLIEVDKCEIEDYQLKFQDIYLNTSSLRIDSIISKIIPTSRAISNEIINNEEVLINYQVIKNKNITLKENDIFSIRKVGKFKFIEIIKINKAGKYKILIKKYI